MVKIRDKCSWLFYYPENMKKQFSAEIEKSTLDRAHAQLLKQQEAMKSDFKRRSVQEEPGEMHDDDDLETVDKNDCVADFHLRLALARAHFSHTRA